MSDRGVIHHREWASRLQDFSKLRYGRITPTNIDLLLDFAGRTFILAEAKYGSAALPRGQELALEHLEQRLVKGGARCLILVGSYEAEGDIDMAACTVTRYLYGGKWRKPKSPITVGEAIQIFRRNE